MNEAYYIYEYGDNCRVLVPRYLSSSDSLEGSYNETDQGELQEGDGEAESSSDGGSDPVDYSYDLSYISSCVGSLTEQVDNLNNNIITLQEDNKITTGLLFVVCVYLVIKMVATIFNKVLGLGAC